MNALQPLLDEFNAALRYKPGDLPITLPVDDSTLTLMAVVADGRGRKDLAVKLRTELYRRNPPLDEEIGATV